MTELTGLSAAELAARIHDRSVSSEEVTRAHLDRIAATDDTVGAFLHVGADAALTTAREVDTALAGGAEPASPLAGVPLGLKDVVVSADMPTTAGSKMLEGWTAPYDAAVVERLRAAGVPIVGKTNMDEFAMGSSTENSAFGPTRNPWDTDRIPGGSGGGSAAALAAGQVPLAIGSDTGGSIRQPAAMTATVGVKPTYGTVSRHGLISSASSLEQAGACGRTVLDTALLHELIAGHDRRDSTTVDAQVRPMVAAAREGAGGDLTGVRVGVISELLTGAVSPEVRAQFTAATETLAGLGAEIVEVSLPAIEHAISAYYLIMTSEVSSNLARYDAMRYGLRVGDDGTRGAEQVMAATRAAGFGKEVKRRIILGTFALSAGAYDQYYGQALRVRALVARDFTRAFEGVDVLVSPTSPVTAWKLGELVDDPLQTYLMDLCTLPVNLAGVGAMSLPAGLGADSQLPVGLQIIAPKLADERLYRVGAAFETARGPLPALEL